MKNQTLILSLALLSISVKSYDSAELALFNKRLFTHVYERNAWGSKESRSGLGSTLSRTAAIRAQLPYLCEKLGIKTILDAPCGDFNWLKTVDLGFLDGYIGLDIVDQIIQKNVKTYGTATRHFFAVDIVNHPLPQADLILCRDCMQHLTDQDVLALIQNIKQSKSRYLLASTYPKETENRDIDQIYSTARITYRNLQLPPFQFPEPLSVIDEGFDGKMLGLWSVDSLPGSCEG